MSELGTRFLIKSANQIAHMGGVVRRLLDLHPEGILVKFEKAGAPRSLSQNALFWAMCGDVADFLGTPMVDAKVVHDRILMERYGHRVVDVYGKDMFVLPKTRKFKKDQMSELIEWTLAWCAERGIPVRGPEDA